MYPHHSCTADDACDRCYEKDHPPAPITCPCCGVSDAEEENRDLINTTYCGPCLAADCPEQVAGSPCIAGDR